MKKIFKTACCSALLQLRIPRACSRKTAPNRTAEHPQPSTRSDYQAQVGISRKLVLKAPLLIMVSQRIWVKEPGLSKTFWPEFDSNSECFCPDNGIAVLCGSSEGVKKPDQSKTYHSGREYKDRLVCILMYKPYLYYRPEWYWPKQIYHCRYTRPQE